jgi:hypothetical protein
MPALSDRDERDADDEAEPADRPLMSRPVVVVPLFLLVVAAILALVFWPRPDAEELFAAGDKLMQSEDPADWDRAWEEYLGPLQDRHPDHRADEVAAYKAKLDGRKELRRAVRQGRLMNYKSEAERLYHRGLGLAQAGDRAGAEKTWQHLVVAFGGVPSEAQWVKLAQRGLVELADTTALAPPSRAALDLALERTRQLKAEGKAAEATAVLDALEYLYRDDPAALDVIKKAR